MHLTMLTAAMLLLGAVMAATVQAVSTHVPPADAGQPGASQRSAFRLSGVVSINGQPRLAVIEAEGVGGRMVRVGEKVAGVGTVTAIGPDWVRLRADGGEQLLRISSAPTSISSAPTHDEPRGEPDAPAPPPAPVQGGVTTVTPEISEAIQRVAADRTANLDDLGLALIPLLDLPADASVEIYFPGETQGEEERPADVSAALARGEAVRLLINESGQEQMLYLMPQLTKGPTSGQPTP